MGREEEEEGAWLGVLVADSFSYYYYYHYYNY